MTNRFSRFAAVVAVIALIGCRSESKHLFEDVTQEVGIRFEHVAGEDERKYFMPRSVGSGAAFLDFDNDGLLDILLLQNGGPGSGQTNHLYQQTSGGRFEDQTQGSGLDVDGSAMGVAVGDVNNDGRDDVLITEYGRSRLFLNLTVEATPRFVDVSEEAALDNDLWGTSCCFFDYNRDGWLDIVLVNYVNYDPSRSCFDDAGRPDFCGPHAFKGRPTKLYENLGDSDSDGVGDARFKDVTDASGIATKPGPGLGVFCADFDGDGWPDIFIANDGAPNHLWMNQQDGTFSDEAIARGIAYNSMGKSEADMGIAIGDVNGDGLFDIFATHLAKETHTLWTQGPRGIFTDRTPTSGLTATSWRGTGFGTSLADLDNDGDLDLVLVNGRVMRAPSPPQNVARRLSPFWADYAQKDQILLNDGAGRFVDVSEDSPLAASASVSRGLACADFDNDGLMDLLVTNIASPPALYNNIQAKLGNWISIRAIDPELRRDAYGAEIYVVAGDTRLMRWVNPGYSFMCSNDPRAHFGLGTIKAIDEVRVVWPDGRTESFSDLPVNRQHTLKKGSGAVRDAPGQTAS